MKTQEIKILNNQAIVDDSTRTVIKFLLKLEELIKKCISKLRCLLRLKN